MTGLRPAPSRDLRPDLSVVVPSVNGSDVLMECLEALSSLDDVSVEVLVVDRCGEPVRRAVRRRFPEVKVLPAEPATTIPELRAIGFRNASADSIAVIEDHVIVQRNWARQMLSALADGSDVVAGGVYNGATTSTVDWAAFLCEYSHLLPTIAAERTMWIAGNNVVYRRALLERYSAAVSAGRWEDHLHAAMRRGGAILTSRPEIAVGHKQHYRVREYLGQRYLYARSFAGLRRADMTALRRMMFTAGSFALPAILLWRTGRQVFTARCHQMEFVRALPLITLFVCAWAVGEAVGYALGPGDALSHVR